jgi:hypothetical protein
VTVGCGIDAIEIAADAAAKAVCPLEVVPA